MKKIVLGFLITVFGCGYPDFMYKDGGLGGGGAGGTTSCGQKENSCVTTKECCQTDTDCCQENHTSICVDSGALGRVCRLVCQTSTDCPSGGFCGASGFPNFGICQ